MIISGIIFLFTTLVIGGLVIWLVKSESEGPDLNKKLIHYGYSEVFQKYYEQNALKKASRVIKDFEGKFPEEIKRLAESKKQNEVLFSLNNNRYNHLISKYQKELKGLRATGSKYFSREELNNHFDANSVTELVEAHIINFYNDMYLLHDKYTAQHPFELDKNGDPIKIEI